MTVLADCVAKIVESRDGPDPDWACGRFPQEADEALAHIDSEDTDSVRDLIQLLADAAERLRVFAIAAPCECCDEYGKWLPAPCDRCRLVVEWAPDKASEHPKLQETV